MELKIDAILPPGISAAQSAAARFESIGFAGLWALETQSDPFQDLAVPALETEAVQLGTGVAIAFARSPFLSATNAWQLQVASRGRFMLGLGTEIKGHIERRFGMSWEAPGPKLREYVRAVRALWRAFQKEERLNFHGRFYTHTLLVPFFDPGPIDYPAPPIYLAAFNPYNCETVGLVADGIMVHPVHSISYLQDVVFPAMQRGLERSGRERSDVQVVCMTFAITGQGEERRASEEFVRSYIAFQGATRTYAGIFDRHGWGDVPRELHARMAKGDIAGMSDLISDEMLDVFAVTGRTDEEVAERLRERYLGVADRICIFNLATCSFAQDAKRLARMVQMVTGEAVRV